MDLGEGTAEAESASVVALQVVLHHLLISLFTINKAAAALCTFEAGGKVFSKRFSLPAWAFGLVRSVHSAHVRIQTAAGEPTRSW